MTMKRVKVFTLMMLTLGLLTACRQQGHQTGEKVTVGIVQYAEHAALDQARQGFLEVLDEAGFKEGKTLKVIKKNAQGEQANLQTMVEQVAGKTDLNFAIATPAAQALLTADSETPSVFTAVTDPVQAGLVDSLKKPGGNMTGSIDATDVKQQVDLLSRAFPQAKKVGIFYNSSEVNSEWQAKAAQKALEQKRIKVVTKTVTTSNDVQAVMSSLASQVDAVFLPTDNTVASTAATIGEVLKEAKVPAMGSDEAYLDAVLFTSGVDYHAIGRQAGQKALKLLKGQKPANLSVAKPQKTKIAVNEEMAKVLGIDPKLIQDLAKNNQ
ncbi:ABC transporter substrate-binding protein [Streptococcus ictaluri]|uniref:ABC transporter substrate binding protein n=1 Tax=Streptococcus ictaluri 707-05 TaxID=764299 RepID=G5K4M7_9STRE|nr:ABC transporter substrate-binding protein [Streptococcus ictaluri]EHI69174.1 ABC transporter substrate binding protein [Streptococcus ictaluri 707-05]